MAWFANIYYHCLAAIASSVKGKLPTTNCLLPWKTHLYHKIAGDPCMWNHENKCVCQSLAALATPLADDMFTLASALIVHELIISLKALSHGHREAHRMCSHFSLMCSQESTWNPIAHRMLIVSNPPREVDWKQIETGLHYYSRFMRGYAYHEIFGLLVGLACHGLWCVLHRYFQFCSCSDVGKERGLFFDDWEKWYSKVKESNRNGSVVLICFNIIYLQPGVLHEWDKPQNSLPALSQ